MWEGPGYGMYGGCVKSIGRQVPNLQHTLFLLFVRHGKEAFVSGVNDRGEDRKQREKQSEQEHSSNEEGKQRRSCQCL